MDSGMPKTMGVYCIIRILQDYTGGEKTLTQEEIREKLQSEYGLDIGRKTVSRHLRDILRYFDEVKCTTQKRTGEELSEFDDDEGAIHTGFYYEQLFERSELQALIYNVIFSKHMTSKHKDDMIKKLKTLGPVKDDYNLKHYIRDRESASEYSDLFLNLEQLDMAISGKKVVEFQYASYDESLKLKVSERIWKVFPLGIAAKNNDYYLVGYVCGSEREAPEDMMKDIQKLIGNIGKNATFLDTFRIDRICDLTVTDNQGLTDREKKYAKTLSLKTYNTDWNSVQDYAGQNDSLSPGRNIKAKFKLVNASDEVISDVIDCFGKKNSRIETKKLGSSKIISGYLFTVYTNDRAMMEFAKKHAGEVEVLEPTYLREELLSLFKSAYERMRGR